jgi:phosphatidylserine decarboxylase
MLRVNTPFLARMSRTVGWLADRRVPGPLRAPLFRTYARFTGATLDEVAAPLETFPSLGAFFVRHVKPEARPIESDPTRLPSPADSMLQDLSCIRGDTILQAKGMDYSVRELLAGVGDDLDLEGGHAWTLYLSPRDYHRVHAPETCRLTEVRWVPGSFYSVRPSILAKKPRVFAQNERAVLRLETIHGPLILVMVGALNVARIRVLGIELGVDLELEPDSQRHFERGAELARFELGSTVILVAPAASLQPNADLTQGQAIKMGQPIADWPRSSAS